MIGPKVEGTKHDGDKVRLELVDAIAIEGLGKVLTFGAKKYAADNWRGGLEYTRIIGGLERHLSAIKRGEDFDPESGLPHVDHLGCCWMFLSNFMKTRPDLDNRWKPVPVIVPRPEYLRITPQPLVPQPALAYTQVQCLSPDQLT